MTQLVERQTGDRRVASSRHTRVIALEQDTYSLLSTGSTLEDRESSRHDLRIVDWDVKHRHKQNTATHGIYSFDNVY